MYPLAINGNALPVIYIDTRRSVELTNSGKRLQGRPERQVISFINPDIDSSCLQLLSPVSYKSTLMSRRIMRVNTGDH